MYQQWILFEKILPKFAARKPCRKFLVTKHYWIHVLFNRMAWPFWILAADGVTSSRALYISASVQLPLFCTDRNCWWFRNPANQLRLVLYPLYPVIKVFYIPAGAGFHSINKKTLCARFEHLVFGWALAIFAGGRSVKLSWTTRQRYPKRVDVKLLRWDRNRWTYLQKAKVQQKKSGKLEISDLLFWAKQQDLLAMTSFKAGRLDSSRGWKERPEERQGCWGPQLHAIRIAKAWLFGGGWKRPGDPSLGVLPRCFQKNLPRNTEKRPFFLKQEKWGFTMMFNKCVRKTESLTISEFFMFAVNICIGCSTCLLLWSACHQKRA